MAPKPKPDWTYKPAPEVEDIAKDLIERHHRALLRATIKYLFTSKEKRSGDVVSLAHARKVGEEQRIALGRDVHFIIVVVKPRWDNLPPAQREALVHHELCHCCFDEMKPRIAKHDFEGFVSELKHYGPWTELLERGVNAAQMHLFEDGGAPDEDAATEEELEAAAGDDDTPVSITVGEDTVETTLGTMRRAACEAISEVVSR